jgi:DNA-binding MarR family transcriptional regulator
MVLEAQTRLLALYPVLHQALRQRVVAEQGSRLSPHQATVLAHLDRATPTTLTELAGEVGVALPTMSLLVDRMVRRGFVRRERDPEDRRRVALRLTNAGVRAATSRSLLDPARVRAALERLTPTERTASIDGLATLTKAARELDTPYPTIEDSL